MNKFTLVDPLHVFTTNYDQVVEKYYAEHI